MWNFKKPTVRAWDSEPALGAEGGCPVSLKTPAMAATMPPTAPENISPTAPPPPCPMGLMCLKSISISALNLNVNNYFTLVQKENESTSGASGTPGAAAVGDRAATLVGRLIQFLAPKHLCP